MTTTSASICSTIEHHPDSTTDRPSETADDLSREVYGIFGIPVDAVDIPHVVHRIEHAAEARTPFLLSTPNLNFLVASQSDAVMRESLLSSDLCTADGAPIVWIARLLGAPIKQRVAGSDIFEALKSPRKSGRKLSVFIFGAEEGVAAAACQKLNDSNSDLICAGSLYPGFGSIDDMSSDAVMDMINKSQADILAAALGAQKGQAWLLANHNRLRLPVRSHLGATVNFQAGLIKRAPEGMRRSGLEWLWRIKEEPNLWNRYRKDGWAFLKLLLLQIFPMAFAHFRQFLKAGDTRSLIFVTNRSYELVTLVLKGDATAHNVDKAVTCFRSAAADRRTVRVNFSETRTVDARFMGCLLMLRKQLKNQSQSLEFVGVSGHVRRMFERNGFGYLLDGKP